MLLINSNDYLFLYVIYYLKYMQILAVLKNATHFPIYFFFISMRKTLYDNNHNS